MPGLRGEAVLGGVLFFNVVCRIGNDLDGTSTTSATGSANGSGSAGTGTSSTAAFGATAPLRGLTLLGLLSDRCRIGLETEETTGSAARAGSSFSVRGEVERSCADESSASRLRLGAERSDATDAMS